ncbi:MAG TPA: 50S ribosomal protein L30 [Geobacterales bacterium]|nr:50S ribosomal protein L30 [Geobacterales bacterium]
MALLAIVRIRSLIDRNPDVRKVVDLLRLRKNNVCVLYPDSEDIKGMLKIASQVITYGEIDKETLVELLKKRARVRGDKPIDESILKKYGYDSFEALAEEILKTAKIPTFIKPFFRLQPPKKGFKNSTKKFFESHGELGYRGKAINDLILRML